MKRLILAAAFAGALNAVPALAETTECTVINTIPYVITAQGVYCLKGDLATNMTSGNAITINNNNVTIDMNGWKLGGLPAGAGTQANGIYALNRINITIRNGSIRGFLRGIFLQTNSGTPGGHLVEGIKADGNRFVGIGVYGDNITVRNNEVVNTGGTTTATNAFGIGINFGAGAVVSGNTINKVNETNIAYGIYFNNINGGEISGNRIFGLNSGGNLGIALAFGSNIAVRDNTVLNAMGNTGITSTAASTFCVDNVVSGFDTQTIGCTSNVGIVPPPPPVIP